MTGIALSITSAILVILASRNQIDLPEIHYSHCIYLLTYTSLCLPILAYTCLYLPILTYTYLYTCTVTLFCYQSCTSQIRLSIFSLCHIQPTSLPTHSSLFCAFTSCHQHCIYVRSMFAMSCLSTMTNPIMPKTFFTFTRRSLIMLWCWYYPPPPSSFRALKKQRQTG